MGVVAASTPVGSARLRHNGSAFVRHRRRSTHSDTAPNAWVVGGRLPAVVDGHAPRQQIWVNKLLGNINLSVAVAFSLCSIPDARLSRSHTQSQSVHVRRRDGASATMEGGRATGGAGGSGSGSTAGLAVQQRRSHAAAIKIHEGPPPPLETLLPSAGGRPDADAAARAASVG